MRRTALAALALAVLLAGCSSSTGAGTPTTGPGLVIESGDGKATLGSAAEVPEGFPAEIPLAAGTLTDGTAGTEDGKRLFNLTFEVADARAALATVTSGLTAAGYTVKPSMAMSEPDAVAQEATSSGWYVLLATKRNVKTGVPLLVYFVRQL